MSVPGIAACLSDLGELSATSAVKKLRRALVRLVSGHPSVHRSVVRPCFAPLAPEMSSLLLGTHRPKHFLTPHHPRSRPSLLNKSRSRRRTASIRPERCPSGNRRLSFSV